jgi:hypothetical protein
MVKDLSLDTILENKNITDSSRKLYKANFVRLNDGEPVLKFDFLKDVETITDKLSKYKENTKRNYIIAITSLLHDLSQTNPKKYKSTYEKYFKLLNEYNVALKDQTAKTDSEKTNWITPEKKAEVIAECEKIITEIGNKRKITEEQYNSLLECLVLSLYTKIAPRRNVDYQSMLIIKKPVEDSTNNYLDLMNKKFIFNKYKTAGAYKTQMVDIPEELFKIITLYLKHRPKTEHSVFLVNDVGEPFVQVNSITRILNKIFNAKVGASMLRKLYLTDKYSSVMADLKEDATAMGTSPEVAKNNYIKDL